MRYILTLALILATVPTMACEDDNTFGNAFNWDDKQTFNCVGNDNDEGMTCTEE